MFHRKFGSAVVAMGLACGASQAQLIVGFDDTASGVTTAYEVRVSDGSNVATPLFGNHGGTVDVWALASDDANRRLYIGSGADLFVWEGAGQPTLIGQFNFGGSNQSIVGLAFADGKLYATKNISNEAVYEVDVVTGAMSIVWDYTDSSYALDGFDYGDGAFYGASDTGAALLRIDPFAGTATQIAAYPGGETDIDGLAVGGGIAYLIEDEPGMTIHRYDLASNAYLSSIQSPFGTSEIFSAGAYASWIPTPGALSLLGLAGLAAARRRR